MDMILPDIRNWFLAKEEYFRAFAEVDSRIEGWFKAEMIILLKRLQAQRRIDHFEREFNITTGARQRNNIDFRLHIEGQVHLCELKALCISQSAGTPRNLHFYFRDDHVGIIKDLRKLDNLSGNENRWVLAFIYPSPYPIAWEMATAVLSNHFQHWQCMTDPQDFPEFTYLALWRRQ